MEKTDRFSDLPPGGRQAGVMSPSLPPSPPLSHQPSTQRQTIGSTLSPPLSPITVTTATGTTATGRGRARGSGSVASSQSPLEFRGFDFFAKREFNDLKRASEAYFAPAAAASVRASQRISRALGPASWLRDPTPPEVPSEGLPPAEGRFPIPEGGKNTPPPKKSLPPPVTTASDGSSGRSAAWICGVRRSRFFMLVGFLIGLAIVSIAIGVGVGVGKGKLYRPTSNSEEAVSDGSPSSSAGPDPTSTMVTATGEGMATTSLPATTIIITTTTAGATASPTPSSNNPAPKLDCPGANGTEYQVAGSTKRFLRLCGVDFTGEGGVDLKQVTTQTMLDCMTNCAGTDGCTGCGWGYIEGDSGYEHRCWLKSKLMKPSQADINWSFAVLL